MKLNSARSAALANQIRELVEDGLAVKGVSARRASMDVVGHDGLIRDIRAGRMPSFDRMIALFEYLSVPFEFGLVAEASAPGMSEDQSPQNRSDLTQREAMRAGFLPFPWHPISGYRGVSPIALSSAWLSGQGLKPDSLAVIEALWEGRKVLALIDCDARKSGENDLWAVAEKGLCGLARVHWQDNQVAVLSWGEDRAPEAMHHDAPKVRFLGRVAWTADASAML